jgi:hypothetical protein
MRGMGRVRDFDSRGLGWKWMTGRWTVKEKGKEKGKGSGKLGVAVRRS